MKDTSHLTAIFDRLTRERQRLAEDPTNEHRKVWVEQAEREYQAELKFLGMDGTLPELSDDDLLKELGE